MEKDCQEYVHNHPMINQCVNFHVDNLDDAIQITEAVLSIGI